MGAVSIFRNLTGFTYFIGHNFKFHRIARQQKIDERDTGFDEFPMKDKYANGVDFWIMLSWLAKMIDLSKQVFYNINTNV